MMIEYSKAINVKAGFSKSDIYPFNRDEVLSCLPQAHVSAETSEHVSKTVIKVLQELRYATSSKQKKDVKDCCACR